MRINSLPYFHEAAQVLMSRLVFKLSSKLSIFISFTSTTPKRLKLQLRRSQFVFPFLGPVICFLRTGPAKPGHQHTGQVASLCHHVPQAMWTQHLSRPSPVLSIPFPDWGHTLTFIPHHSSDPCICCSTPDLSLPPAPDSHPLHPAAAPAEIFPFSYSF